MQRSSGILLHSTALPSKHGIGDCGPNAYAWIDFLVKAKQKYWQILPLGPIDVGNSPYQCLSAFAGNPLLISLDELIKDDILLPSQLETYTDNPSHVEFSKVIKYKMRHLIKAYENIKKNPEWQEILEVFNSQNSWLQAYSSLNNIIKEYDDQNFIKFQQYIFFQQWGKLKTYANKKGIKIIGDLPMYVALNSSDALDNPSLFDFTYSAGAPPSDLYPQGQNWGNAIYNWDKHRETDFNWWVKRIKHTLSQVDIIRLDYFCGFNRFWAISGGKTGGWKKGMGYDLFNAIYSQIGDVDFIAEDLGDINSEVAELRKYFSIAGMKILHYAFDGNSNNMYLPNNFDDKNYAVYTGTHDNNTTKSWYESCPEHIKTNIRKSLNCNGHDISWDLIKCAAHSKANLMILPYQDILSMGKEARFNVPCTVNDSNWAWRVREEQINDCIASALCWLITTSKR